MSLGNTVLQLFCCYYSLCLYRQFQFWIYCTYTLVIIIIIIITISRSEYDLVSNPLARYSREFHADNGASLVAFGRGQSAWVAFFRVPKATVQVGSIQEGVHEKLVGYFLFPCFACYGNLKKKNYVFFAANSNIAHFGWSVRMFKQYHF